MGRMELSEGGKWDNCNSIINKIYLKKEKKMKRKKEVQIDSYEIVMRT